MCHDLRIGSNKSSMLQEDKKNYIDSNYYIDKEFALKLNKIQKIQQQNKYDTETYHLNQQ